MSISSIFDIAGSGMAAQSLRLNTTASNLANAQSASSSVDEVYRARHPVFRAVQQAAMQGNEFIDPMQSESSVGVKVDGIVESDAPLQQRYEPQHPKADKDGYVYYPNVNVVEEMADMISSSRSFQMNVEMMNSAKTMMRGLLSIGQ